MSHTMDDAKAQATAARAALDPLPDTAARGALARLATYAVER